MPFLFAFVVGFIIFIIYRRRIKKEKAREEAERIKWEKQRKKEEEMLFQSRIRNLDKLHFEKDYFEKLFWSWYGENPDIEAVALTYKQNVHCFREGIPKFMDGLRFFEEHGLGNSSLFLSNKNEFDAYVLYADKGTLKEQISDEIIHYLPYISSLKSMYSLLDFVGEIFITIANHISSLCGFKTLDPNESEEKKKLYECSKEKITVAYKNAIKLSWKELCKEKPQYNQDAYYKRFCRMAMNDTEAFENWANFWCTKIMAICESVELESFGEEVSEFYDNLTDKYLEKNWFKSITKGFNEYSTIYEISDLEDDEEIHRIVELYKSGVLTGKYSKLNDPKYINTLGEAE